MRVAIVHNAVAPDAPPDERDVLTQVDAVSAALRSLDHAVDVVPCTLDLESLKRRLLKGRPDVVFNLVEALGGSDRLQSLVPALLDVLEIPYTGAPSEGLFLASHKLLAKERLTQRGLPTPAWETAEDLRDEGSRDATSPESASCQYVRSSGFSRSSGSSASGEHASATRIEIGQRPPLGPPFIVKAVFEHASFGMDDGAVVRDAGTSAQAAIRERAARFGKAFFAEAFIPGREFNLSVLGGPDGPDALPPAEIDFSAFPAGKPRIVGYAAKWSEGTFEFDQTPRRFDFPPSDEPLLYELKRLAVEAWRAFGLRGYARVDFRVDESGRPWILEVNANPCLSPDAGFAAALARAGLRFDDAVARIVADM